MPRTPHRPSPTAAFSDADACERWCIDAGSADVAVLEIPASACAGLMLLAARELQSDGALVIYGPFFVAGEAASAGNLSFDADLRLRNPQWGLRWMGELLSEAASAGLRLQERVTMPAHNLALWLRLQS